MNVMYVPSCFGFILEFNNNKLVNAICIFVHIIQKNGFNKKIIQSETITSSNGFILKCLIM